ncbi:MAG TPA: hypothetical protein VGD78_22065 [Chthoniobacterales bacterium]
MKTFLIVLTSLAFVIGAQAQDWGYDRYGRKQIFSEPRHKESKREAIERERVEQKWHHDNPFTDDNPSRRNYHEHIIAVPK